MYQLFESIRLENGVLHNLKYHQDRLDQSLKILFNENNRHNLSREFEKVDLPEKGLFKCRVSYDKIKIAIKVIPYIRKPVSTLKIIRDDDIEYNFKFEDRNELDSLFSQRGDKDDILIIKNNLVTDTSIGNILLKKNGNWVTPLPPLFTGTQRSKILDEGLALEKMIRVDEVLTYDQFMVVNAMLPFDRDRAYTTKNIE